MPEIETELVKATKVKETSFRARQDYLAALVRGVDKLDQDKWDNLSDEAVAWHAAAVAQMDKKRQIEDFGNVEPEEIVTQSDGETEADEVVKVNEGEGDAIVVGSAGDSDKPEEPEPQEEVEEKKPIKQPKAKKVKEPSPNIRPGDVERYGKITGEKDRFGITIGTKTHDAVKMYNTADGATLKQTGDKLGGRHYNILAKLAKDGHKVEKLPGGVWRVTHKDD